MWLYSKTKVAVFKRYSQRNNLTSNALRAEAATDKRSVESLPWSSEEWLFFHKELGGMHCRWNAYHQNLDRTDEMKHFKIRGMNLKNLSLSWLLFAWRRTDVWCLCPVTAAYKNFSVHLAFWSLGPPPLPPDMSSPKTVATCAAKAMVISHVCCDLWCLYSCDFVISEFFIIHGTHSVNNIHFWQCYYYYFFVVFIVPLVKNDLMVCVYRRFIAL